MLHLALLCSLVFLLALSDPRTVLAILVRTLLLFWTLPVHRLNIVQNSGILFLVLLIDYLELAGHHILDLG